MLRQYFNALDAVLDELKPIVEKIAIQNTIIVMVCNVSTRTVAVLIHIYAVVLHLTKY